MKNLIPILKRFRGTIGAVIGAAGVGGATVLTPSMAALIASTHSHQAQVEVQVTETPLWVREISQKIDEKYIMTCGAN